jgi:hypothetical protein
MSALNGGGGEEQPDLDLDLDRPAAGDAQVVALFRDGLPPGRALDLGAIERRAKRRHRRTQAMASGVVTMVAAMAAVAVVVSPWSSSGNGGQVVPAGPTPSISRTALPGVTKASLLQTSDLQPGALSLRGDTNLGKFTPSGSTENLSGQELIDGVCVDNVLKVDAPGTAWEQRWVQPVSSSKGVFPVATITERVAQWPGQPDQAAAALEDLRSQLADCTGGPGLEGLSPTTVYDDSYNVPTLFTTLLDGEGIPFAQGWMMWDDTLVAIEFGPQKGYEQSDAQGVTANLLQAASYRLIGEQPGPYDEAPLQ